MKRGKGCVNNRVKSAAMALFFCLIFLACPLSCYAMDYDYLNAEKWDNSQNVKTVSISKSSVGNTLDGVFKFYRDCENNCLYLYFFVEENTLKDYQDVKISLTVDTDYQTYNFSVDENGMCDQQNEEQSVFQVCQNFSSYSDTSTGLYIAALQSNAFANSSVDVSLHINGHRYIIVKAIKMEEIQATTANSKATVNQRTAKTTVKSDTKSTTAQATTKFKPSKGDASGGNVVQGTVAQKLITQPKNTNSGLTDASDTGTQATRQNGKARLSKTAMAIMITASAIALAGIICIISAAASPKSKAPEKSDGGEQEAKDEM